MFSPGQILRSVRADETSCNLKGAPTQREQAPPTISPDGRHAAQLKQRSMSKRQRPSLMTSVTRHNSSKGGSAVRAIHGELGKVQKSAEEISAAFARAALEGHAEREKTVEELQELTALVGSLQVTVNGAFAQIFARLGQVEQSTHQRNKSADATARSNLAACQNHEGLLKQLKRRLCSTEQERGMEFVEDVMRVVQADQQPTPAPAPVGALEGDDRERRSEQRDLVRGAARTAALHAQASLQMEVEGRETEEAGGHGRVEQSVRAAMHCHVPSQHVGTPAHPRCAPSLLNLLHRMDSASLPPLLISGVHLCLPREGRRPPSLA